MANNHDKSKWSLLYNFLCSKSGCIPGSQYWAWYLSKMVSNEWTGLSCPCKQYVIWNNWLGKTIYVITDIGRVKYSSDTCMIKYNHLKSKAFNLYLWNNIWGNYIIVHEHVLNLPFLRMCLAFNRLLADSMLYQNTDAMT
jgi:hypothetical protein